MGISKKFVPGKAEAFKSIKHAAPVVQKEDCQ